jgi:hypothetical protein
MQRYVVRTSMFVVSIILSCVAASQVAAAPAVDSQVNATITCQFESGSQLTVHAQMLVNKITVFDHMYDRQAIEALSSTDPYIMGAIMLRLHESLRTQVNSAFNSSQIDTMNTKPVYALPYFTDDFRVNLTPLFFSYMKPINLSNFLNGVLDMGAVVTYHCNLTAEPGWNISYIYRFPAGLTLDFANTPIVSADNDQVEWDVKNSEGGALPLAAVLSMRAENPTTPLKETEDISIEFMLDAQMPQSVSLTETMNARDINVRTYVTFPSFVTGLHVLPADGVRLCIDNGLLTWNDVWSNTIQPIEQHITPVLENSSFNQTLQFSFSWNTSSTINCSMPYNLTHMDSSPAVQATFKDPYVQLRLCGMSARAFFGLINAGASATIASSDMNFGQNLEVLSWPTSFLILLPSNITLDGKNSYGWNQTVPLSGAFSSNVQPSPPYTSEQVSTVMVIDIAKMDLNLGSIFSGKTELTASAKLREDDLLSVIRWPSEFLRSPKINLTYLNADAFRLCTEEQVFSGSSLDLFLSEKKDVFQQRASGIIQGLALKGLTDRKVFTDTLRWDGDISAMDALVPVDVSSYASQVYTVGFSMSLWPATLTIAPQHFNVQGIGNNQTITYRFIFPKGISVNASDSAGTAVNLGKTQDGRDYVDLVFTGGNQTSTLTCVLNASPVYVLGIFLPCLLVFVLLVILVVVIYLIRKKRGGLRRGKKKLFEPEDNEPDEEMPDYYVPPPPSSKRRK